jgi:hypothetical protein
VRDSLERPQAIEPHGSHPIVIGPAILASFGDVSQDLRVLNGVGVVPCGARNIVALLRPHLLLFSSHNSDFGRSGRSGRCAPMGRRRFGPSQNPGCGAGRSEADAYS